MSLDTYYKKVTKINSKSLDREVILQKPIYVNDDNWQSETTSTNELILIAMEQILQRLDDIEKKLDEYKPKTLTVKNTCGNLLITDYKPFGKPLGSGE